jgi:hypothetical protein
MKSTNLIRASIIALAFVISSLSQVTVAGEKRDQSFVKTHSRTTSKTTLLIGDMPNHELSQEMTVADVKYSNPDFKIKDEWTYIQSDTINGSGKHSGYYFDTHEDGSTAYGNFQGTVKTIFHGDGSWESTWEGTYQYLGGSGKYKNIKGAGEYRGKASSKAPVVEEGRETVEY